MGLIVVGDEILSGKRADKHLSRVVEILAARGLSLSWAEYVGDTPVRIRATLVRALASTDLVFCTGGIGATPDDHTRQCAAAALGVALQLHPQAEQLIMERMRDLAQEKGIAFEPDRTDNLHRLNMGVFPLGAQIIPNPYNKIPGFSCAGSAGARVHFVPGFPVMAWPMIEWVLDTQYRPCFHLRRQAEMSIVVYGGMEATLTPLMIEIEAQHPRVKVFSLPSVDHPVHGRHIELGVKGVDDAVAPAFSDLKAGLHQFEVSLGPELVR